MPGNVTAVVVGGSIAGLCAARALAKRVDRVVVIEADREDSGSARARKGVPQGRYPHALLRGGERALDRLFPKIADALLAEGAVPLDTTRAFAFLRAGGWSKPFPSGFTSYWCTRAASERAVRRSFSSQARAEIIYDCKVTGVTTADSESLPRVTGVELRYADGTQCTMKADLVVDASGRSSQSSRWLERLGIPEVAVDKVDAHVTYAGRWYTAPAPEKRPRSWWWQGLWVDPVPGRSPFFCVLLPAENGRWFGGLAGFGPWDAPHDESSFMRSLRAQRTPLVAEALALAPPDSELLITRSTINHFRHFERGGARMRGLLALGDAVCSFNPVYGQGMSVAAQAAVLLEELLDELGPVHPELPERFFQRQARLLQLPWSMATGADLQFATTEGPRPLLGHLLRPYFGALMRCAQVTPSVMRAIAPVFHLDAGVEEFLRPRLVLEVLRHTLSQRVSGRSLLSVDVPSFP